MKIVISDRRTRGLSKANALQNAILNSAGFSSIATDETGVIRIFNAGAERMLGYTAAEVVDKLTPADVSDAPEAIERAKALSLEFSTAIAPGLEALAFKASRGIEDNCEWTCIRKDGNRFRALVSVSALHGTKNQIIGYLLIAADNTAHQAFRRMVESVTDCGIAQLDAKGRVLSWNAGAQIIDGYSAQEIVGQHFSRFYSSEEVERGVPQRDLDSAAASGRCETQRWRARDDGSTYCAKMVLRSFHDADGTLRGFARLTRDIGELTRDIGELTRDSSEPPQRSQPPPMEAAPKPALRKPKPAPGRSRVLFVQDHPASLGIVEQLVARRTDVLLVCAANVDLAIEMAQAEPPEVILLDLDLPGIDAIQFMNVVRANPATENTPILALSPDAEPAAMAKGLQAGFFHYLARPLNGPLFMEALADALEFAARERAEENDRAFTSSHSH